MTDTVLFHEKSVSVVEETLRNDMVFPLFDDAETMITPATFIDLTRKVGRDMFKETGDVSIKYTHPKKFKKDHARNKKGLLGPEDYNMYSQRTAFTLEVPGYDTEINGYDSKLVIAGIKPYDLDVRSRSSNLQHFKLGIGYQVGVCLNLCISSVQGANLMLNVRSEEELEEKIGELFRDYSTEHDLVDLRRMDNYTITKQQFATILGNMKIYQSMQKSMQSLVPKLELSGSMITRVAEEYVGGPFESEGREIPMWKFYNYLTSAVKTGGSMTQFLDQNVNAFSIANGITNHLAGEGNGNNYGWYLN